MIFYKRASTEQQHNFLLILLILLILSPIYPIETRKYDDECMNTIYFV